VLGSPGTRAIALGICLDNRALTFLYHCGTSCVGIYELNSDSGALRNIWTGDVESNIYWARTAHRVVVETRMGGLTLIDMSGHAESLPGCHVDHGIYSGYRYIFECWSSDEAAVHVHKSACEQAENRRPNSAGQHLIWSGEGLTPLR
jgi:hypothetical protein